MVLFIKHFFFCESVRPQKHIFFLKFLIYEYFEYFKAAQLIVRELSIFWEKALLIFSLHKWFHFCPQFKAYDTFSVDFNLISNRVFQEELGIFEVADRSAHLYHLFLFTLYFVKFFLFVGNYLQEILPHDSGDVRIAYVKVH